MRPQEKYVLAYKTALLGALSQIDRELERLEKHRGDRPFEPGLMVDGYLLDAGRAAMRLHVANDLAKEVSEARSL